MTNAPCFNCPARSLACHSTCVAYREWAEAGEKYRKAKRETYDADAHTSATVDTIRKRMHMRRRSR